MTNAQALTRRALLNAEFRAINAYTEGCNEFMYGVTCGVKAHAEALARFARGEAFNPRKLTPTNDQKRIIAELLDHASECSEALVKFDRSNGM